ncbi:unnamed protein product [Menidia menidia]|uniref:(Atlantic silverside) hypothetical protein n=1 Tax=Menidia menidia TaxID=238744 RepID=A0A8S4BM81_9TELE|nr:unnamed protein product [Menidia menidia]
MCNSSLFTEVPHDITTHSGEDVEMACSFRGAGPSSYSLEIQWWYIKNHRTWREKPADITNSVLSLGEMSKDATKISVVKVAGSNISHKLRLSSVRASDEGTYECRVIDYSGPVAQHHRVWAYLQVEPGKPEEPDEVRLQQPGHRSQGSLSHSPHNREASKLRKATAGSTADCNESCEF